MQSASHHADTRLERCERIFWSRRARVTLSSILQIDVSAKGDMQMWWKPALFLFVKQGSPTLLLESYRPTDFSANQTHLNQLITVFKATCSFQTGVLEQGSSPGAGLVIPVIKSLPIYEVRPSLTTFTRVSFVFIYGRRTEWALLQLWKAVSVSTAHTYTCQAISHRQTWTSDSHLHENTPFLCSDRSWTEPTDTNLHELYWPATFKSSLMSMWQLITC